MKKYLLIVVLLSTASIVFSQNRCTRPLSSMEFSQRKQQISSAGNNSLKLQTALKSLAESCYTSAQIKDLMLTFEEEYSRLELAEKSYATVFDPENFYDVYDGFKNFSSAIRLYDFVVGRNAASPATTNPLNPANPASPSNTSYPSYNYPNSTNYTGVKGCGNPVADSFFDPAMQTIRNTNSETMKFNVAKQFVSNNCISTEQAMKTVSLLSSEINRLDLMRAAYRNIYDVGNLSFAGVVFQTRPNQDQWASFLAQNGQIANPQTPDNCVVETQEFTRITTAIRSETVSSARVALIKGIARQYHCFSIEQVRQMVKEFGADSQRLDIAKYLYDYTAPNERRQYFLVGNEFSLSSNRTNLSTFLANKR